MLARATRRWGGWGRLEGFFEKGGRAGTCRGVFGCFCFFFFLTFFKGFLFWLFLVVLVAFCFPKPKRASCQKGIIRRASY